MTPSTRKKLVPVLEKLTNQIDQFLKGGAGSGNFGHSGRPGHVGGSGSGGGGGRRTGPQSSEEMYRNEDGSWKPERVVLHERIIKEALSRASPVDFPVSYLMGGGPASGKSAALRSGAVDIPQNIVSIDSDAIKQKLPEYNKMVEKGDSNAANFVHEESSYISKRILQEAVNGDYNTILDGTGNSSIESLERKVNTMRDRGRKVVATYVTVDTQMAVDRAMARAEREGRFVPESFIRHAHSSVSNVVPLAIRRGLFDEFSLYDTSAGGSPRLVVSAKGSSFSIADESLWNSFLAKAEK